jgi:hypothetical protein
MSLEKVIDLLDKFQVYLFAGSSKGKEIIPTLTSENRITKHKRYTQMKLCCGLLFDYVNV